MLCAARMPTDSLGSMACVSNRSQVCVRILSMSFSGMSTPWILPAISATTNLGSDLPIFARSLLSFTS